MGDTTKDDTSMGKVPRESTDKPSRCRSATTHRQQHDSSVSTVSRCTSTLVEFAAGQPCEMFLRLLQSPNGECPLKHPNAFGLSSEHNVPGIPCDFMSKKMLIVTPNRCFYHLITYHHLRNNAARRIMEVLSSTENKDIDLTSIDLFSHLTSKEVLSTSVDLFVALCPLTHGSVYGLRSDLHYTSCNPRTPVHLCQQ